MIEIRAGICPVCKDIIYSRAHHDCQYCSCTSCFIDGGSVIIGNEKESGYIRVKGGIIPTTVKLVEFDSIVEAKKALYDDWNKRTNKYGRIST
jgi:hypothetical protein